MTYDAVTYATSHGAMAYATPPFLCPTQDLAPNAQLNDGIRALEIEVHAISTATGDDGGGDGGGEDAAPAAALALCLGDCSNGELPLAGLLGDVAGFFAVNPREVVTLLVAGGVDANALATAFHAAGLDTLALPHASGDPWPTLGTMIANGTRLVVFAGVTGSPPPWMLSLSTYVASTGSTFASTSEMTCAVATGAASAPLYALNEYLVTTDDASPDAGVCASSTLAQAANADPFFQNRVTACTQQHGSAPTFLVVDFCDVGDVQGVAHAVNDAR
jgi:hypothetical protein